LIGGTRSDEDNAMQMFKIILVSTVTLATGMAAGWVFRGTNSAAAPAPDAWHPSTATTATTGAFDPADLRAMVRTELKAALANGGGAAPAAPAPGDAAPPTPELIAKRQAAVTEIEGMIKGGEWGNDQRMSFQQHIVTLAPDQAARVLHDVTVALNEGRLHVTTAGPPL
jgi:hypothetical protein